MPIITPPVDAALAAWLKSEALFVAPIDTDIQAVWTTRALDTAITSAIANRSDAVDEATRQLRFLGGPLVRDEHVIAGARHDLIGRRIRLRTYAVQSLGYDGEGVMAFVVGAVEADTGETTTLTVLRRLDAGVPPPATLAVAYISPGGAGDKSGNDWANAAPLTAINTMVSKAYQIAGEVWIRADAGVYNQASPLSITTGGVTIRGVDVNGNDMIAELVGNRASPWTIGAANGSEMIRLNRGADNLAIRNLRFRNVGGGCIRMREPISNILIENVEGYNVGRFIVNYGNGSADATVTGAVIRNFRCYGFSKHGIQFRHNSRDILIEDGYLDSQDTDGDFITCGVQLDDRASYGVVRRVTVKNVLNTGPETYYNGDGFSGEVNNHDWLFEDIVAENISDGGVDIKGLNITIRRMTARRCKRSVRLWGIADVIDLRSEYPTTRGGSGASCHIFAMQGTRAFVRVQGGTFIQSNTDAVFRVDDHAVIAADAAALAGVQAPGGTPLVQSEASDKTDSLLGTWDHGDFTPPTITTDLNFSCNENLPATWRIGTSEIVRLEKQGPDAGKVQIAGRDLILFAQDYEKDNGPGKPQGPAADYSKTLKFQLRAIDVNGNASPWYDARIEILDVPDDKISPAEAVAQSGATNGFWYDFTQIETLWVDVDRTVPAQIGDLVKLADDQTGFGNHLLFPDGREPRLVSVLGYPALQFEGQNVGLIGKPGGLRFPKFTSFFVQQRNKDTKSQISVLLFSGLRSRSATSSNNTYQVHVRDTQTAVYHVNPGDNQTSGSGTVTAPAGRTVVMSHRSTDGTLVSGYDATGMALRLDGPDVAAVTYPLADQQPLLGAGMNEKGEFGSFYSGYYFAAAMLDVDFPDDIRFRSNRQLGRNAGAPIG